MGVQGFTTYFKGKSGKHIFISDESKKEKLLIGIDGNALMYFISDKILSSVGSYVNLYNDIKEFFQSFIKHNIEVVVFMDGYTPIGKFTELEKRYESKLSDIKHLVNNLIDPNVQFPFTRFLPPKLLLNEFKGVLKELGIHYHGAFQESDNEMKQWVVDNKGKVYGVVSNDSDFLFFNLGDTYYFPLSDLKVSDEEIYGLGHTSKLTSSALGVEEKYLPMIATLCGNDYTKHIRSKFRGNTQQRIDSIVRSIASYHGVPIQSIIRDNYHRLDKRDQETCLDSYLYYLPQSKPTNVGTGYTHNGLFFRYSDHRDFSFVKNQPWFDFFFSIDCASNYNNLSLMRSPQQQSSIYQLEPAIPLSKSFAFKTAHIRDRMFGLLAYELRDVVYYDELIPSDNTYSKIQRTPVLGEFGILSCWTEGQISLERKIQELCQIFNMDRESSKRLSKQFQSDEFAMNDLILILFLKYLKGCKLIPNSKDEVPVQDSMIDSFILHYVMLAHQVHIDISKFNPHKQSFLAIQFFDYYSSLTFMATTTMDILAITKVEHRRIASPHQYLDCVIFQILWNETLLNNRQGKLDDADPFILFESFKPLITDDMKNHFNELKSQVNGSSSPYSFKFSLIHPDNNNNNNSNSNFTTTTTTTTTSTTTSTLEINTQFEQLSVVD